MKENLIKDFVENKLSKESKFLVSEKGDATFRIDIKSVVTDKDVVRYFVEASLTQEVVLVRDKTKSVLYSAPTWKRSACGYSALPQIQSLLEKVSDLTNEFISDSLPDLSSIAIPQSQKKSDSPFKATYVGGNRPPEVEIFNDSDRTLYLDFGQDKLIPYTILPGAKKIFKLTEGIYKFKATAPRVVPLKGQEEFNTGYVYSWRFTIVKYSVP